MKCMEGTLLISRPSTPLCLVSHLLNLQANQAIDLQSVGFAIHDVVEMGEAVSSLATLYATGGVPGMLHMGRNGKWNDTRYHLDQLYSHTQQMEVRVRCYMEVHGSTFCPAVHSSTHVPACMTAGPSLIAAFVCSMGSSCQVRGEIGAHFAGTAGLTVMLVGPTPCVLLMYC
jgi:hypothetical protein